MLIFPYNRSDPLAYVFEHSLTGPLIALTVTRMGGDGVAGSVEPRGPAVGWNRAGSRLRSFALVRQMAPPDRQITHRLVIAPPKAPPPVVCILHYTGYGHPVMLPVIHDLTIPDPHFRNTT